MIQLGIRLNRYKKRIKLKNNAVSELIQGMI